MSYQSNIVEYYPYTFTVPGNRGGTSYMFRTLRDYFGDALIWGNVEYAMFGGDPKVCDPFKWTYLIDADLIVSLFFKNKDDYVIAGSII